MAADSGGGQADVLRVVRSPRSTAVVCRACSGEIRLQRARPKTAPKRLPPPGTIWIANPARAG